MSLRELNPSHLKLISLYSTRYAVRGGAGIVFLLLVLIFGLITGHSIVTPVEQIIAYSQQESRSSGNTLEKKEILNTLVKQAKPLVAWALEAGVKEKDRAKKREAEEDAEKWSAFLLEQRPALLSAILLIILFALPFLVAAGAFNQYSGDVQSRGIRFQLLRTERSNIFFGRFLGIAVFSILIMGLLMSTIVIYIGAKLNVYPWRELILWGAWGFLALAVLSLPYIALCGWVSTFIDSPFASFTVSSLIIGAVPLFALLAKKSWEPLGYMKYLLPWGFQNSLLHNDPLLVGLAFFGCLAYMAVFLALGHRHFLKRDL